MSDEERDYHNNKLVGKTYIGKRFGNVADGQAQRIASKVFDGGEGVMEIKVGDRTVIRTTPRGRHEIKATFYEDGRSISVLTIQKFNSKSGPSGRENSRGDC